MNMQSPPPLLDWRAAHSSHSHLAMALDEVGNLQSDLQKQGALRNKKLKQMPVKVYKMTPCNMKSNICRHDHFITCRHASDKLIYMQACKLHAGI